MIRSMHIEANGERSFNLSVSQLMEALNQPEGLVWISLEHPTSEEATSILEGLFHFHHLAIEDCLNTGYQTPKVDDYGSHIFIIAHAIRTHGDEALIETSELNIFLGKNYLVTLFQEENLPPVDTVWQRVKRDERLLQNGPDFLCYGILDAVMDDYMPILDNLDDELEKLENQALSGPNPNLLQRLLALKHALIFLRRVISPQREVINRLSRDEFPMIDHHSRIYYRDVYDQLVRFQELIESMRDVVSGALDIYLNSTSLRLNEVMKALTIVSTIFLPLSFIAGVYGMNFDFMPELHWRYGYLAVWIVFILIALFMLYSFKRRGWF